MLWHPKFLFGFIKIFYLIWGGYLKFSSKRTLPLKNFLLWQVFYLDSPKTWFWSWRFFLLFGLKTKCFSLGKFLLKNLLNSPMAFWSDLLPFQKSLLPWPKWKSTSINLSPSLDHDIPQIQQVEPLHIFVSIYFPSKTISAFYLDPWRFTKELPFLLWVLPPNQFP